VATTLVTIMVRTVSGAVSSQVGDDETVLRGTWAELRKALDAMPDLDGDLVFRHRPRLAALTGSTYTAVWVLGTLAVSVWLLRRLCRRPGVAPSLQEFDGDVEPIGDHSLVGVDEAQVPDNGVVNKELVANLRLRAYLRPRGRALLNSLLGHALRWQKEHQVTDESFALTMPQSVALAMCLSGPERAALDILGSQEYEEAERRLTRTGLQAQGPGQRTWLDKLLCRRPQSAIKLVCTTE